MRQRYVTIPTLTIEHTLSHTLQVYANMVNNASQADGHRPRAFRFTRLTVDGKEEGDAAMMAKRVAAGEVWLYGDRWGWIFKVSPRPVANANTDPLGL
jgi:hypothetical protein